MSTGCRCSSCRATSSPAAFPIPVLQQVEDFGDGTVSANDCFRPVSRYFDRITRPEQIIPALQRAMAVLTDPAECGPVTLAFCQDVQAEAFDYPESFFAERLWLPRRVAARRARACRRGRLRCARRRSRSSSPAAACSTARPMDALAGFAEAHGVPVAETQAGKSSMPREPPAGRRLDRRHRHLGRQCARRRGRRDPRRRHAAAGFHHRLVGAVPQSRAPHRRPQRPALRRRTSTARCRSSPMPAPASTELSAALAGWHAGAALAAGDRERPRRLGRGRRARHRPDQHRAAVGRAGDRRRPARAPRPTRSSSAPPAGCRANCTSSGRPSGPAATTWNTAIPAWATRSPAASASSWRCPTATSSSWSATAPI